MMNIMMISFILFVYYNSFVCSMALDFDQYLKEWQGIATTLPSDITYDTIYEVNG